MNRVKSGHDAVLDPPHPPSPESTPRQLAESELLGRSPPARLTVVTTMGLALLCSGGAALANQVVRQRSLKRFLGGNETISSMLVVLVFMLGLGVGSILMGRRAARIRDPLRAFGAGASSGKCNWSVEKALRLCGMTMLLPLAGFYV